MNDVFLSYARADRPRAKLLFDALHSHGLSVWWDPKIMPGESWRGTIRRALADAKCVIVLWSTTSVESRWVQAEAEEASNRGNLFPVLIDDVSPPIGFGGIQNANLIGWTGSTDNEEIRNLSEAIRTKLSELGVVSVGEAASKDSGGLAVAAPAPEYSPPLAPTNQAEAAAQARIEIGQTVSGYQIVALVGRGGMGKVFKVRSVISDRTEAMKVLLDDATAAPDLTERFLREIKMVASLEHPNIAALRTAFQANRQLVMVMEFVEGSSLDQKLRGGRLNAPYAVDCMRQVLSALAYAHRQGVIHRDIKPGNILIASSGVVKLTDFGIASKAGDAKLTATGTALGSLYYMSPEQVKAAPLDARSDLYSVGATLYECVTGQHPFLGDSSYAIMQGHLELKPAPPTELRPDVPAELSRIILKALEKRPENRFQTAEEFGKALQQLQVGVVQHAAGYRLVTPPPTVPVYATPDPAPSGSESTPPRPTAVAQASAESRGASRAVKSLDAPDLEKLKKELAIYIGPMARVIVARAAKNSGSLRQLYETVAAEIPSPADRQKFLASRAL
jgi:eukaryotic-like serine/threonine-protein kinase